LRALTLGQAKNPPGERMTATPAPEDTYRTDKPITASQQDRFNRWPFAQRVAQTIAQLRDPSSLVIAIFGVYGEGKSSVLNLLEEELRSHAHIIVLRFNPWHFADQNELIRAFFSSLAETLGRSLVGAKEKIGGILADYGGLLAPVPYVGAGASDVAKSAGRAMSTVKLAELRKRVEAILRQSGKRIVIIMDDIDRLDRSEIQSVFKLVKLAADFDHTAYVLAFDREMVAAAIAEKYSGHGTEGGQAFLEKIIQVPLGLPPADKLALRHMVFQEVDSIMNKAGITLSEEEARRFGTLFIDGLEIRLKTPRAAKRYANAIAFSVPILKEEVNTVDLLLFEGVRVFYPHLYSTIVSQADTFLATSFEARFDQKKYAERGAEVLDRAFEKLSSSEKEAAEKLTQALFPQTTAIFGKGMTRPHREEIWDREQRLASIDYFGRFVQYAIGATDLPDRRVRAFLESIPGRATQELVGEIHAMAADGRAERLVDKLRLHEKTLDAERAEKLALAVGKCGDEFPNPHSLALFDVPFSQAAILVRNLVASLPAGEKRDQVAGAIIEQAEPILFAFECLRWIRRDDEDERKQVVSPEVQKELEGTFASRVAKYAREHPPHLGDPQNAHKLYWIWSNWDDKAELSKFLQNRFDQDPSEGPSLVACYLPRIYRDDASHPRIGNLTKDGYGEIASLIDPDVLLKYLTKVYGSSLDKQLTSDAAAQVTEERAAREFASIHRELQKKNAPDQLAPQSSE
jgi:hypothetical protein